MNLNYAIFRSQPIYTLQDLAQIGSHNKREKKAYNSNPNIKIQLTKNNIELVPLTDKYVKGFYNLTKEYKKEHDERMKTEREDRKKTFNQMLNKSKNVVADELLFTATHKFFDNMTRDDIKSWANTCMEFVYKDLGYTKEQVLHATVHLDEETPHLHCVVVPLVKKYDKRTNTERFTISKKQYIKDKVHLSELQDKYYKRLTDKGYDLERGIKGSNAQHQNVKELKKTTKYYKTTKNILFDKEYVKVKKDTFECMNKVIIESQKIMEFQPKIEQLFTEVKKFTKSHKTLEKENQNLQKEIKSLITRNENLSEENSKLKNYIDIILMAIKRFFRKILQYGNEIIKAETVVEIKDYYDNNDFDMEDVVKISNGTSKEDELFNYIGYEKYYNLHEYIKLYDDNKKNKDDSFQL